MYHRETSEKRQFQRLRADNKMEKNIQKVREDSCGEMLTPMLETHPHLTGHNFGTLKSIFKGH